MGLFKIAALDTIRSIRLEKWLGWKDSNLRYTLPKSVALPLGYTPTNQRICITWLGYRLIAIASQRLKAHEINFFRNKIQQYPKIKP